MPVATKQKVRIHREWFDGLSKTVCTNCKMSSNPKSKNFRADLQILSWGEYHNAKWNTLTHFCNYCVNEAVIEPLRRHADPCGCAFEYVGRGISLPVWLTEALKGVESTCSR